MKRASLNLAITLPALALLAACGGGTTTTNTVTDTTMMDNTATTSDMAMDNAMAGNAMGMAAMTGQDFANTAAGSDAYEIAAGRLAQEKATAPALKEFGAMMVTQHTDATNKLKAAGARATPAITPNPAMNPEQDANLATLRDATGADFDNAYKSQQVVAHQKTLAALESYAANGDVPELKAWATETIPVVRRHLEQIQGM